MNTAVMNRHMRRTLLTMMGGGALIAALQGCAQTPTQLANDVNLVVAGGQALVAALSAIPGIAAGTLAAANAALASLQANAQLVGNALAPQGNVAAQLVAAIQALSAIVSPFFPAATLYAQVALAIVALGQTIYSEITGAAPTPTMAAAMTADTARAILKQFQRGA